MWYWPSKFGLCLPLVLVSGKCIAQIIDPRTNLHSHNHDTSVSYELFSELEELSRIVDIAYCVGFNELGIAKPFECLSRCSDFPNFELIKAWNTGQLMSDSCGYVALSHGINPRIIVAFRGTYSLPNAVADLATTPQKYTPYSGARNGSTIAPTCENCTIHTGFSASWNVTAPVILPYIEAARKEHPLYQLVLTGHSLGGAVAALAGLYCEAKGWMPTVTTFGEPRIGNAQFAAYFDTHFDLQTTSDDPDNAKISQIVIDRQKPRYRRVTHAKDPVPLLPLEEWGYRSHAGEIYISAANLPPDITDLRHCTGDNDPHCIAGPSSGLSLHIEHDTAQCAITGHKATIKSSTKSRNWNFAIPNQYKLWRLLTGHRDYFWRLGLCIPGSDPWNWGRNKYSSA